METGLAQTAHPPEPPGGDSKTAAERESNRFDRMMVYTLGKWIGAHKPDRKALGQCLDDADFQCQPTICDLAGERS